VVRGGQFSGSFTDRALITFAADSLQGPRPIRFSGSPESQSMVWMLSGTLRPRGSSASADSRAPSRKRSRVRDRWRLLQGGRRHVRSAATRFDRSVASAPPRDFAASCQDRGSPASDGRDLRWL
jgi:hypothetical protein